jgi:hypothetical protein
MKAFPTTMQSWDIYNGRDLSGMDLRDYFAAKAMQGILATDPEDQDHEDGLLAIAIVSYKMADAMMKAREE